jgi:trk system potassium uptake protein TrkH
MILPLGWALYDGTADCMAFIGSISIGIIISFTLFLMSIGESDYRELRIKEAFAVVGFSWLIASTVGALPYVLSGILPNFTDAFFEAMSGFSTTAASVVPNIASCPRGILFWRSFTLWLGGMGIIVLGLAIMPFFGVGGMELYKTEVPGPTPEKLTPRVHQAALLLWEVYVLLTLSETILLMFGGMSLFDALTHSLATIATGGFSIKESNIAWYNNAYIDWVITVFMFLSGTNFVLHYKMLSGGFKGYLKDDEFRFYLSVILICITISTIVLRLNGYYQNIFEALRYAAFQIVSMITTTGYSTADYESWPYTVQVMLLMLMFLGGCAGSTSGGMKNMRVLILFRSIHSEFKRILHPNAVTHIRVNGKVVSQEDISSVITFIMVFILVFISASFLMTTLGIDITTSFSSVTSALCNIGPGFGLIGPVKNYSWMPDTAKWILSLCMLAGRLELYVVIMLLLPTTWKK